MEKRVWLLQVAVECIYSAEIQFFYPERIYLYLFNTKVVKQVSGLL